MVRIRLIAVVVLFTLFTSSVGADFSRRYMHAVDQLFRGVLSSSAFQKSVEDRLVKRQELGTELLQLYNGFMSNTSHLLDFSAIKLPSMQCLLDLMNIVGAARSGSPPQWALRFADAFFKPPAGLLDGNLNWLGAFDECVAISVNEETIQTTGQYCLVPVYMDNSTGSLKDAVPGSTEGLNLGVCLPKSCSPNDIAALGDIVNKFIHSNKYFNASDIDLFTRSDRMRCHDPDLPKTRYFIAAMTVIGLIVFLNLASTLIDIVLRCCGQGDVANGLTNSMSIDSTPSSVANSPIHHQQPSGLTVDNTQDISVSDRASLIEKPPSMAVSPNIGGGPSSSSAYNVDSGFPRLTCVQKRTTREEIVLAFSFLRNAEKLLNTSTASQSRSMLNFGAMHGIRTISLLWVILGHTFILPMASVDNIMPVLNFTRHFEFQVVNQALLAVDTFFVLSGFFVGYVALRQMDKFAQVLRSSSPALSRPARIGRWFGFFGCFYVHRYLRLTPLLAFVLIAYMGIAPYLLDGPLWIQSVDPNCVDHWWANLLYVNNAVRRNEECIGWTWYLAVDTQLFVVAPLPLLCFFWRPFLGWLCALLFLAASAASNAYISYIDDLTAAPLSGFYTLNSSVFEKQLISFETNFFADLYIMPWCRCAAWIIGLGLGCSLSRMPASFSNAKLQSALTRKMVALFGWLFAVIAGLAIVYGLWPVYYEYYIIPQWVSSFYWAGSRIAWGLIVTWVIYVCISGAYGARPLRSILAYPGIIPLSRLSYCAYLIHPIVLSCFFLSVRNPTHFTGTYFAFLYCGTLLLTFVASFIVTVAVEMPFANLDKFILPERSRD